MRMTIEELKKESEHGYFIVYEGSIYTSEGYCSDIIPTATQ